MTLIMEKGDVPEFDVSADPLWTVWPHNHDGSQGDKSSKQSSLRQRFMRSLNHRRSFPSWQPRGFNSVSDATQERYPSSIRKSIDTISSTVSASLKGRLSIEAPADSEDISSRPSVIRRSFGSMSSSLRGISTSMGYRPSRDEEQVASKTWRHDLSDAEELEGSYPVRARHHTIGHSSSASSSNKSIPPRLPGLDEMIANARTMSTSPEIRSPNTLFSMSIFDSLDRPFVTNDHGDISKMTAEEHTELAPKSPAMANARLPFRLVRPSLEISIDMSHMIQRANALDVVPPTTDGGVDDTQHTPVDKPATSKVPVKRLDDILETSTLMRDDIWVSWQPTEWQNTEEGRCALAERVHVAVPDEKDHRKPWPKKVYPGLYVALHDVCTRFRPFYAPFAVYTSSTRTVQLFPADFPLPTTSYIIRGSIFFTIQHVVENFDELVCGAVPDGYDFIDMPPSDHSPYPMRDANFRLLKNYNRRRKEFVERDILRVSKSKYPFRKLQAPIEEHIDYVGEKMDLTNRTLLDKGEFTFKNWSWDDC
ncbi:hypothetical protein M426DRAFT_20561 [Hypoxylon sp. CI-4A]|nr:hypothetical protein M426DRAFT_20561 [Hypoxylon sp. CI-4A]